MRAVSAAGGGRDAAGGRWKRDGETKTETAKERQGGKRQEETEAGRDGEFA